MSTVVGRTRRCAASSGRGLAGLARWPSRWHGVTFFAWQSQAREDARHGGHAHPELILLLEPETELFQRGIRVCLHPVADQGQCCRITARPTTAGMGPWGNLSGRPAPMQQLLHKCVADAEQRGKSPLGAKALVIGMEDFLAKINRPGLHACQSRMCSPSRQLQTALVAVAIEGLAWVFSSLERKPVYGLSVALVVWTNGTLRIPLGLRLWRKSGPSKYALALELLSDARHRLRCRPDYVLCDVWYPSKTLLKRIRDDRWYFV
jgi:hypothetical protein